MNFLGATTGFDANGRRDLLSEAAGAARLRLCLTSAESWKLAIEDGALENDEAEELAGERTWLLAVDDCPAGISNLAGLSRESGAGAGPGPG